MTSEQGLDASAKVSIQTAATNIYGVDSLFFLGGLSCQRQTKSYASISICSCNTTHPAMSPITLTQVAPISHNVLILIYTPMTPAGSPAIVASAAKDAIAPPGIPGVPTDRSTFAKSTSTIMEMLTFTLHALAKNMIINDIKIDTASIFTVAPSGMVILET